MLRTLRFLSLSLALCLALPAAAASNYQDMWWLPSESGWGLMVLQQGDTISAVLFHYRADRKPAWYLLSSAPRGTEDFFSGTLYEVTGPSLFTVFDPATVLPRPAGSMTLHFTSANTATVSYTIDNQTTQRSIQRITFANLDVDGTFVGAQTAVVLCEGNPLVGNFVFPAEILVLGGAVRQTRVTNTLVGTGGVACDWGDATFTQVGSMIQGQGRQVCRGGDANLVSNADFEVEQMRIIDHAITINYRATVNYPASSLTCTERGLISGTRLVNPN